MTKAETNDATKDGTKAETNDATKDDTKPVTKAVTKAVPKGKGCAKGQKTRKRQIEELAVDEVVATVDEEQGLLIQKI